VDAGFLGGVSFNTGVNGQIVVPGTRTPATTDSLSLKMIASGSAGAASSLLQTFDAQGDLLSVQRTSIIEGTDGNWITLSGPGISSFEVSADPGLLPAGIDNAPFVWGVAAVDFIAAPAPTSLTLAGFGLLGLAGWCGRRRATAVNKGS
jgi:hypothetical protein